jgi:uncharacterized Tic20 family protein
MASLNQALQSPSEKPAWFRSISITALASVIAVTILVGSEVFVMAFASAWAMIGLMDPVGAIIWVLYSLAFIVTVLVTSWFAQLAWKSEMQPITSGRSEVETC